MGSGFSTECEIGPRKRQNQVGASMGYTELI